MTARKLSVGKRTGSSITFDGDDDSRRWVAPDVYAGGRAERSVEMMRYLCSRYVSNDEAVRMLLSMRRFYRLERKVQR